MNFFNHRLLLKKEKTLNLNRLTQKYVSRRIFKNTLIPEQSYSILVKYLNTHRRIEARSKIKKIKAMLKKNSNIKF